MTMELALTTPGADSQGSTTLEVSDNVFGVAYNEPLVHQVVTAFLASGRAGTRAQKNRAAVQGGGSKPWRQKGTGRARAGSSRSPLWRGGGRAFPAAPRDFGQKVNRKMYRAGLRSILSEMVRQNRVILCDEIVVSEPRTKALVGVLNSLKVEDAVIVTHGYDRNLWLAARNLHRVNVCEVRDLDPVVLVGHETLVGTSGAVRQIEEWLQ